MYDDVRITATATSEPTHMTRWLFHVSSQQFHASLYVLNVAFVVNSGGSVEPACLAVEAHEQFVGFDIGCSLP